MILSRRTKCHAGWFAGVVLLLNATAVLPLSAMVRADDETNRENTAAQQRALGQDRQKAERALEVDRRFVRKSLADQQKSSAAELQPLTELRHSRFKAVLEEADRKMKWVGRGFRLDEANAMEDLWKIGFDDKLIESLIRDREKTQSVINAIETILSVTDHEQADDR